MRVIFLSFLLFLCACSGSTPTGTSDVPSAANAALYANWSPNIGVHPFAFHRGVQQKALAPLIQAGNGSALSWVRVGADQDGALYAGWFRDRGVNVVVILPNEVLRNPNIHEVFSDYVSRFSGVRYWEIGNEVDHFISMPPEEYMPIFRNLYMYAKERHPGLSLIANAPFGTSSGAALFERMLNNGLLELATHHGLEVVSLHFYSNNLALHKFSTQIERLPAHVRVWITETGVKNVDLHISHVNQWYPELRNVLRADKIFFYVLAECTEHALVLHLAEQCGGPIEYSPLYEALIDWP